MGKTFDHITEPHAEFIRRQHMFFVATAPGTGGHVNVSPKGLDTFRVLSPTLVAYADYTGSGIETIAHIRDNGRLTIMFCAFDGTPNILRLYGRGRVTEPHDQEFAALSPHFNLAAPLRSIISLHVTRVSDSCGWGVPLMEFKGTRSQLTESVSRKTPAALAEYHASKNRASIDGLPGLPSATKSP